MSSIFIPTVPLFWILSQNPVYLILVPGFIEGFSWSGFNLSTSNFIYDAVKKELRGIAVSYFNLSVGFGIFFGGLVGAALIGFLKIDLLWLIIGIFSLSAFLRMIVIFYFTPLIIGNPRTQRFKSAKNLRKFIFKEFKSSLAEEAHQLASIKHYLEEK